MLFYISWLTSHSYYPLTYVMLTFLNSSKICFSLLSTFQKLLDTSMHSSLCLSSLFYVPIFKFLFTFLLWLYYSGPNFSLFVLLCPTQPHSHRQSPHCCPCPWVICTCSLSSPFPLFWGFFMKKSDINNIFILSGITQLLHSIIFNIPVWFGYISCNHQLTKYIISPEWLSV